MFSISSPAFESGGLIPAEYATNGVPRRDEHVDSVRVARGACGDQVVRPRARSTVRRSPSDWVHWIVYDIPASVDLASRAERAGRLARGREGAAEHASGRWGTAGRSLRQAPASTPTRPRSTRSTSSALAYPPAADSSERSRARSRARRLGNRRPEASGTCSDTASPMNSGTLRPRRSTGDYRESRASSHVPAPRPDRARPVRRSSSSTSRSACLRPCRTASGCSSESPSWCGRQHLSARPSS